MLNPSMSFLVCQCVNLSISGSYTYDVWSGEVWAELCQAHPQGSFWGYCLGSTQIDLQLLPPKQLLEAASLTIVWSM